MTDHPSNPPSQERITAAAIQVEGVIYTGPHHATIIHYVAACVGIKPVGGQQGFVTNWGRFVDRSDALPIAIAAGQVDSDCRTVGGLFSEMLWIVPEDAALAAQEARHKAEMEEVQEQLRLSRVANASNMEGYMRSLGEAESKLREATEREKLSADLLEFAWGVIANAHGGDWSKASDEWLEAAVSFRERWHAMIGVGRLTTPPDAERYNRHIEIGKALAASEDRERRLVEAMTVATIRLEILLGHARGCDSDRPDGEPARHGVTEIEVPGWIEDQRALLTTIRSGPAQQAADKKRERLHASTCAVPNAFFVDDCRCTCGLRDSVDAAFEHPTHVRADPTEQEKPLDPQEIPWLSRPPGVLEILEADRRRQFAEQETPKPEDCRSIGTWCYTHDRPCRDCMCLPSAPPAHGGQDEPTT